VFLWDLTLSPVEPFLRVFDFFYSSSKRVLKLPVYAARVSSQKPGRLAYLLHEDYLGKREIQMRF